MTKPSLSLAMTLYANKGAHALMLGSGISTGAGLLTGWQMRRDFIQRAAALDGADVGDDPDRWFEETFGKAATYSNVVETFDSSQGGRAGLLRSYFEPTEEERELGLKVPSEAHRAIAALVTKGYIRIILTTNFDRLLEQALDARAVSYQVIASSDDINGVRPFLVEPCTIIKINGNYRDIRFKNTEDELSTYDPGTEATIKRVLDEFGLIVCGWSAESDTALVEFIRSCRSRLYGTYWTYRTSPKPPVPELIEARNAQAIKIEDANSFFGQLEEHVTALERSLDRQPLDARAVSESVKRYVTDDRHRVALEDLLLRQTRDLLEALPNHDYPGSTHHGAVKEQLEIYETVTERMRAAVIAGCYWGQVQHHRLWSDLLTRLARLPGEEHGYLSRPDRRLYPALLLLYSGGIAAVAARRYDNLACLLVRAQALSRRGDGAHHPLALEVYPKAVLSSREEATLSQIASRYGPLNYHLRETLKPSFAAFMVGPRDYEECFDRFEYLAMLVAARLNHQLTGRLWGPSGRLVLLGYRAEDEQRLLIGALLEEARAEGDDWGAVRAGLFSSADDFQGLVESTRSWSDNC